MNGRPKSRRGRCGVCYNLAGTQRAWWRWERRILVAAGMAEAPPRHPARRQAAREAKRAALIAERERQWAARFFGKPDATFTHDGLTLGIHGKIPLLYKKKPEDDGGGE